MKIIHMQFRCVIAKSFIRDLKNVDPRIRDRIGEILEEICREPFKGKKLDNYWSWRIGDYRIIYIVDEQKHEVLFLWIGHRRSIYKRLRK